MISKAELLAQAREISFKPEIYEKVQKLLTILEQVTRVAYLKERLVLKGGTALNLFYFESLPRLSMQSHS